MNILLTGATGVLGAVVAEELAPAAQLTCLTRRRRLELPGVAQLPGDLTAPALGLDSRQLADLVARTDVVVHSGAMTGFSTDPQVARRVNAEGTERVLDVTARAGARLVHVSTAFIARIGEFDETAAADVRSPLAYLRSKVEAESLVAGSGLDAVVVRPSVLIGDSRTGAIGQFQGWHSICGSIITDRMPFLPSGGTSLVDCVPVDQVARAIAGLVLDGSGPGSWWLTAGDRALTLQQSLDVCLAVAAERGLAPHRPRLMPREMVERLVLPAFAAGAPPALRKQMVEGVELMRLFGSEHRFPRDWPGAQPGLPVTDDETAEYTRTSLRYWCDRQGVGVQACVA